MKFIKENPFTILGLSLIILTLTVIAYINPLVLLLIIGTIVTSIAIEPLALLIVIGSIVTLIAITYITIRAGDEFKKRR